MSLCLVQTEAMEATVQNTRTRVDLSMSYKTELWGLLYPNGWRAFMCVWKEKGEDDEEIKITRAGADHQEQIE